VDGNPLTLGGVVYPHGLGTHANSRLLVDLKGAATRFDALVGVDDEKKGSPALVRFEVLVGHLNGQPLPPETLLPVRLVPGTTT